MKRVSKFVFGLIIVGVFSINSITIKAEDKKGNAQNKVSQAIKERTFYNYMMAYIDILDLPSEEQGELLNQLAPVFNDANTLKVQKARTMLETVAKNKDGKTYAETETYLRGLSQSDMDIYTKGYLLGELTSWGKQFVFTSDYTQALDALLVASSKADSDSISKAEILISNVKNQNSKNYLAAELAGVKLTIPSSNDSATRQFTVQEVAKKVESVVYIETKNRSGRIIGTGSGFLISSDGKIITNYHVIEDAFSAEVTLQNGTKYNVQGLLDYSYDKDIAIVKLKDAKDLKFVEFGDPSKLELGEQIIAIGSPEGFKNTVSTGIVSGLDRESLIREGRDIQINAAITYGSSGGALFNMKAQVVGITYSGYEQGDLNFAIPISEVKDLLIKDTLITFEDFQKEVNPTPYFNYLSDVPQPEGIDYDKATFSKDGEAVAYYYSISKLPKDFIKIYDTYLYKNGWKYYKSEKSTNGDNIILYYIKDKQMFGIFYIDDDLVIYGEIR